MAAERRVVERFLEGRRALVTASSRNLGAAIAGELAMLGASVCIQYHASKEVATQLVEELRAGTGRPHAAVAGDMSVPESVREVTANAESLLGGGIDILVNNAGPFSMTPYASLPESEWDAIWNTNVKASFIASQSVADGMRRRGWGRIINISAGSAYLSNHSIYGLAKNAMIFLTEQLALELGPSVTVNAVAPGQIAESAADIAEFDPTFVERALKHTPAGRLVTRREVAGVVGMLCCPVFDMVTGVTLAVDGGWRLNRF
jgi:NAD(P)-dependent dehydrogenase (short-subunit alcohol dehydrogenase family)